jgi:putative tryptophan/tyrosine transport system substrate-binding protein
LELFHELVPNASVIALLTNPQGANNEEQVRDLQEAARALGLRLLILNGREIDSAFATVVEQRVEALFVTAATYFYGIRNQIALLAARHNMPTIYESHEFTEAGGLVSYGVDFSDVYRQLGVYAGKILKGEKPANLPVLQPTKLELVINLQAAKVIGLTIPASVLLRADRVIE